MGLALGHPPTFPIPPPSWLPSQYLVALPTLHTLAVITCRLDSLLAGDLP
jgi:hypothetical protein